jgi:hypothetical protein
MAETDNDWEQTLHKMAQLETLSTAASTGAKMVSDKRSHMVNMVSKMTQKLKDIQSKINKIKDEGNTAKKACKDLIKIKYGPQQEEVIKGILENIKTMTNTEQIDKHINDMSAMVGRLQHDIGVVDDAPIDPTEVRRQVAADAAAAAPAPAPAENVIAGGYTYGKSKRKGKGRRKRTKKSRKKGSKKK